jgi:hypothetical protein
MRFRKLSALFVAAAAAASPLLAAEDYSTWGFSRTLTVNTTATGGNVSTAQYKFPLLVRLTPAQGEVFANSKSTGADLRFTKADGVTRLPHQIEQWDKVNQVAAIWVQMDTVLASDYTTIRMFWSNPSAADSSRGNQVFNLANDFQGVWHLGNSFTDPSRLNSVTNKKGAAWNHFGLLTTPPRQGLIGWADTLRGNGRSTGVYGDYIKLDTIHASGASTGKGTLSMWVKPEKRGSTIPLAYFGNVASSGRMQLKLNPDWTAVGETFSASSASVSSGYLIPGEWNYVVFSSVYPTLSVYVNGSLWNNATAQTILDITRGLNYIGRIPSGSDSTFRGMVDEVTFSREARSADWVRLSYATQKEKLTVVTLGPALPRDFAVGRIHATEFVSTPKWKVPDYVFEPDYDLRSLEELEAYVKEHKHLPEVPAGAKMEKGMDLADMNLQLLKTVEELTLHVIDLGKRSKELEERIDSLLNTSDAQ